MIVGVDLDSFKATLCAVPFDGGAPVLAEARWRKDSKGGDALSHLDRVPGGVAEACHTLAEASPRFASEPHAWFLERGFGASRRSDFIMGAFTGAVFVALSARPGDAVNLMEAREWKAMVTGVSGIGLTKQSRGNGNAPKAVANEAVQALLGLLEIETTDWTPDQFDAYGIAFTGRRLNARAVAESVGSAR